MRHLGITAVAIALLGACRSHESAKGAQTGSAAKGVVPTPARVPFSGKEDMIRIAGGQFRGRTPACLADSLTPANANDPAPEHGPSVDLHVEPFEIDKDVVSCADLLACENAGACHAPNRYTEAMCKFQLAFAVHDEAQSYCAWRGAHLPTLYQWQRAVRGLQGSVVPWGAGSDLIPACAGEIGTPDGPEACNAFTPSGVHVHTGLAILHEWTGDTDCGKALPDGKLARLSLEAETGASRLDEIKTDEAGDDVAVFRCARAVIAQ